jgi:hypothetical protein
MPMSSYTPEPTVSFVSESALTEIASFISVAITGMFVGAVLFA